MVFLYKTKLSYVSLFYNGCVKCTKRNGKKTKPNFEGLYFVTILFKFGMWGAEGEGICNVRICCIWRREHAATHV